jgi:hypothetical protein
LKPADARGTAMDVVLEEQIQARHREHLQGDFLDCFSLLDNIYGSRKTTSAYDEIRLTKIVHRSKCRAVEADLCIGHRLALRGAARLAGPVRAKTD